MKCVSSYLILHRRKMSELPGSWSRTQGKQLQTQFPDCNLVRGQIRFALHLSSKIDMCKAVIFVAVCLILYSENLNFDFQDILFLSRNSYLLLSLENVYRSVMLRQCARNSYLLFKRWSLTELLILFAMEPCAKGTWFCENWLLRFSDIEF